jgi:ribosome maturation factor RimP
MKVTDTVRALAEPVAAQCGCSVWDVEFVREGGEWFLRVYLDKEDGVDITDCEAVSRAMDPLLDEADPIEQSYTFEVCSAGLERVLKRPGDFERFLGSSVCVRTFSPVGGAKEHVGTLTRWQDGDVTITRPDGEHTFTKAQVAQVRLHVDF